MSYIGIPMNCIRYIFVLVLACPVVLSTYAAAPPIESDGSILLPAQAAIGTLPDAGRQQALTISAEWRQFNRQHGAWTAFWNEATATPHRAFGEPIAIQGYSRITNKNVQGASLSFLNANASGLRIRPNELKFVRASHVGNKWYVTYRQLLNGVEVLLSEIELRISDDARVFAFGVDFYADAEISSLATLPIAVATQEAGNGLVNPNVRNDGRQFVLPVRNGNAISYHLVYEIFVESTSPVGNYVAFVDAHDGQILWRQNRVRYADVKGRARGTVQLILPTDPFVEADFKKQYVNIGGVNVLSDTLGRFVRDIASSTTLSASLLGASVNINRADGPDAFLSMPVNPGDSVNVLWSNANSHPAERDGFYHTTLIHDYITRLDPAFTNANYSMPCAVNINDVCNAYWDGFGINFFAEGGGCPNTAQMADVVYHEYGHGINDKLYEQLGAGFMINGATHEGMADVVACMIMDDARLGRGFFGPGSTLRNLDNSNRYPQNVSADPHITGLIIGGTFWDLREATSLETASYLSHFAKYGLPDDPNAGIAFGEWFVETIIADDDDGNITNGTPHLQAIVNSFGAHGIGSALFFGSTFLHTPVPSSNDTTNAYQVFFQLAGIPIPGGEPESVMVHYSTDGFQTITSLNATVSLPGEYSALIPPQPWGSFVRYFITAYDGLGQTSYAFPAGAPDSTWYKFAIGFQRAQPGVLYASSGVPSGKLYSLNTSTGAASPIGVHGSGNIQALAIHPVTRGLLGFSSSASSATVFNLSPQFGDGVSVATIPLGNIRAAAFTPSGDTLYVGTVNGRLYRVAPDTWDTTFVGVAAGISYGGFSYHPQTGALWASVRPVLSNRDRIYTVNTNDGQVTLIGTTGDGNATPSIAFAPDGILFGLKGVSTQSNALITISTATGVGDTVGVTGVTGLLAITMSGDSVVTSVGETGKEIPSETSLEQNYPNPFNPTTEIGFRIVNFGLVTLKVFDVLGREVATLVNEQLQPGTYERSFNGSGLSSGIYFYRLQAGDFSATRKLMLLK